MQELKNRVKKFYEENGKDETINFIGGSGQNSITYDEYVVLMSATGDENCCEHILGNLIKEWDAEEGLNPIQSLVNRNFKVKSTLKDNVIKFHVKKIEDAAFTLLNNIYIQSNVKSVVSKRSGSGITILITLQ